METLTKKKQLEEDQLVLPIAEIFNAPQGEGLFVGQLMTFIRLAGCNVGKPVGDGSVHDMCKLYDGREFKCDTNYRVTSRMTIGSILSELSVRHICITGGEPLIHNSLQQLVDNIMRTGHSVHIETSGTVSQEFIHKFAYESVWITVSPKMFASDFMLARANEIKLLVDKNFDIKKAPPQIFSTKRPVYLQPVNNFNSINDDNMQKCLEIQTQYPFLRISTQMHKIWKTR